MIRLLKRAWLMVLFVSLDAELEDATIKCRTAARKLARAERWRESTSDALERVRKKLEET